MRHVGPSVVCLAVLVAVVATAVAGPHPSGISYQTFLKDRHGDSLSQASRIDSLSKHTALSKASAAAGTSSTGVLQLLNTTDWRGFSALCFMNGYLFTASQYGVLAFDMTNPSNPRLVSKFYHPTPNPWCMRELVGTGGYLYLLTPGVGLEVLDATQPSNIQLHSTFPWNETLPCSYHYSRIMELAEPYLYISSSTDSLFIFDVSTPAEPSLTTSYHNGPGVDIGASQGIATCTVGSTRTVYLSSDWIDNPLTTIDVSEPYNPVVANVYWGARAGLPVVSGKLVRSGHYLMAMGPYWPKYDGGPYQLKVMDLTDPLHPQFACSTIVADYYVDDFVVDGSRLYVETGTTYTAYDITDPCRLVRLGAANLDSVYISGSGELGYLLAKNNWLYSAGVDQLNGPVPRAIVAASDITNLSQPISHVVYSGKPGEQLAMSESAPVAVVSSFRYYWSTRILDVSQPTEPQLGNDTYGEKRGSFQAGIDLQGTQLYSASNCGCYSATSQHSGLACIDLTDPKAPYFRWQISTGNRNVRFLDVAAASPYYYVAAQDSGLYVFQEPSPGQLPVQIAALGLPPEARAVAVKGNRAYVACWGQYLDGYGYEGAYLAVVDISNPTAPSVVGYQEPWGQYNIEAYGNRLATTSRSLDHWAVTLYEPDSTGWPNIIGSYDPPDRQGNLRVLKLHGNYLYVRDGGVLDVVDISNPARPERIDQYTPLAGFWDVAVRGDIVYLSENCGIKIFRGPSCCDGLAGNINLTGIVDLADLSLLISYLVTPSAPALVCSAEADFNASGVVDLSDLSFLIAYLVGSPKPSLPACP